MFQSGGVLYGPDLHFCCTAHHIVVRTLESAKRLLEFSIACSDHSACITVDQGGTFCTSVSKIPASHASMAPADRSRRSRAIGGISNSFVL